MVATSGVTGARGTRSGAADKGRGSTTETSNARDGGNDGVANKRGDGTSAVEASTSERLGGGQVARAEEQGDKGGTGDKGDKGDAAATKPSDGVTVPGVVSVAAAGAQGAFDGASSVIDRAGRQSAADILTRRGGNLPAAGFANRAELATRITGSRVTVAQARTLTPFSANAGSTRILDEASEAAGRLKGLGRAAGYGLQPAVGAVQEFRARPDNATAGESLAALVGGGLKEADDVAVSGGAGAAVGFVTTVTGVGAPAAPYAGATAGLAVSQAYDGSRIDAFVDNAVDDYVEPFIASAVDDFAVPAANAVADGIDAAWNGISSLFR